MKVKLSHPTHAPLPPPLLHSPLSRLFNISNAAISYGWKDGRTSSHLAASRCSAPRKAPRRSITALAEDLPQCFLFKCHWWDIRLAVCSQTVAVSMFFFLSLASKFFIFSYIAFTGQRSWAPLCLQWRQRVPAKISFDSRGWFTPSF